MASKSKSTGHTGIRERETAKGPVFDWEVPQKGKDEDGKKFPKLRGTEPTLRAAIDAKAAALAKRNENPHVVVRRVTVADFITDTWLPFRRELMDRGTIEPATLKRNERDVKNRIIPYIGDIELQKLSTPDVDTM